LQKRVAILEMTGRPGPSQSPRDRILWILTNSGRKLERSGLRRCTGIRYADMNHIIEELEKEGRIRVSGETITLL